MAEKNLAVGSIPKLLIRLALPVLGGFLLQSAYALIDMYWVGFLGADALGGLSICLNLHLLVLTLGFTLGVSGLATISRAFGSGDRAAVPLLFQQVFWQSLTVGVAACLLTLYLAEPYFDLFTNDPGVRAEGLTFYRMFTLTFVFSTLVMAASFCWRAVGDFVTPPILMALSVVINLLLDPLLIFGWGPVPALGMEGVALATVLAQAVPFGIYLYLIFLRKQNTLLVVRRPFRVDWKIQWRLLRIGVPAGMQSLFATLAMMAVYRAGRPFGGEAAAAVGVGFRLIQAGILPMVSLASALGSVVGQNLGARLPDRIHSAVRWSLVYVLALTLSEYALLASAPEYWVRIFTS
ncbi:MAG: MATE family efflux transporter, partial [Deltaproteobacteria bacterium]|nr:MATE family efflux transporter [Deltaproteobacteria bacterium]